MVIEEAPSGEICLWVTRAPAARWRPAICAFVGAGQFIVLSRKGKAVMSAAAEPEPAPPTHELDLNVQFDAVAFAGLPGYVNAFRPNPGCIDPSRE